MDRTEELRALVKATRLRLRAQKQASGGLSDSLFSKGPERKPSPFAVNAKNAANNITELRVFLMKNRKEYINSTGHLASEFSTLTEKDRERIDNEAQDLIKLCQEQINMLPRLMAAKKDDKEQQLQQHCEAVYKSLVNYLKEVCQLYSEQRAVRVRRIVDKKRSSRLQPEGMKWKAVTLEPPSEEQETQSTALPASHQPSYPLHNSTLTAMEEEESLTEDERATLHEENAQLFDHMNSLVDEVRQIEGAVVEISQLQRVFTEKVLEQAEQLDWISRQTTTSTENIHAGNEQIREAIRNQGSFRMWILFILLVLSFSLLFLDWYD